MAPNGGSGYVSVLDALLLLPNDLQNEIKEEIYQINLGLKR